MEPKPAVRNALPPWAFVVLALALSALAWGPMLHAYPRTQGGDGPVFQKALEAALVSVTRYHEFPFWNPYECGGLPLWDNPQSPAGAPLVWTMALFGTTFAMALSYVVHTAAGLLGMALFARRELALGRTIAFLTGCAWAFAGVHAQHYGGGHFAFLPFLYLPLAFLLWRRAEGDDRAVVGLGVLVALMVYEGAVYPLPHFALFLGFETLLRIGFARGVGSASRRARAVRIVRAASLVTLLAVTVSAARLLPVLDQLAAHKRGLLAEHDALSITTLREMFLARDHARTVLAQEYVWPEYGAYLGPIVLGFAVIGLVEGAVERVWLAALGAFAAALMLGHVASIAPWSLLKGHIFPFREMRVPSRFNVEVTFALCAFAGVAASKLPAIVARAGLRKRANTPPPSAAALRRATLVVTCVFALGVADVLYVGTRTLRASFPYAPLKVLPASPTFYYGGADLAPNLVWQPRQNRGRLACWEEWAWGDGAPLWEGDLPQARVDAAASPPSFAVANVARTQNTFAFDVDAPDGGVVRINSAFDRQWRTTLGDLEARDRLLVLVIPKLAPGPHAVVVRYAPRLFGLGLALTSFGVALSVLLSVRARRLL